MEKYLEVFNESIDILLETTESNEGKKVIEETKKAINEKDDKKIINSIKKLKSYLFAECMDPTEEKNRKAQGLLVGSILISYIVNILSIAGFAIGNKKAMIASIITYIVSLSSLLTISHFEDSEQKRLYTDKYIKSYKDKLEKLKKEIDKFKGDKKSVEYLQLLDLRDKLESFVKFLEMRKRQFDTKDAVKKSKKELKEIKKTGTKEEINDTKKKVKTAKELARNLVEAVELLDEAAARNERKAVKYDLKKMKLDETVKSFMKGDLDKDSAKKVYDDINKGLKVIESKINEIPEETTGEKVLGYFRSSFTVSGYTRYFIASLIFSVAQNTVAQILRIAGLLKDIGSIIIFNNIATIGSNANMIAQYNKLRKTEDGEKNWNKAYAEDLLKRFRNKLDKIYNKYYK